MKIYIYSLIVGIVVGIIYSVVNVRSPAPPTWALVGLLGMLIGEQAIPFAKQHIFNSPSAQVEQTTNSSTNDTLDS